MDNRESLQKLAEKFSPEALTTFLRVASGKFHPQKDDYRQYLSGDSGILSLSKVGQIDYEHSRLIVLAGQTNSELTSHSGRRNQYEIAKKVLKAENLDAGIFVFHDQAGHFRFSLITANYTGTKRDFSTFRRYTYFVTPEADQNRTFIEQIGTANFSSIEKILEAFSVDPVTKEFFRDYKRIFEEAEKTITLDWNAEQKRLYTQRFFNRLMFLTFLERKGWMNLNGRKDYLRALFADYHENEENKRVTFHRSRLNTLFFWGLNNPRGDERGNPKFQELKRMIGEVPYLNGGLFDQESDDETWFFPDSITAKILKELLYRYNFTVTESTPLDVEVAVDPEMLGRIFEELVTGRHESGSYYTPKPVVAFMCREALKGYLGTALAPKEPGQAGEKESALAVFVDKNDASQLKNPEAALAALRAVKVCDPACGSGAYLLGMLHELLEQRECLFAARVPDVQLIYDRKLEIIQNNLYGVDKDDFAVNIARLRLWLSLIVDFEGETPPPLPNLDFKIESGDSLTAPDPSGGLQPDMFRRQQVQEFLSLKNEFLSIHAGAEKKKGLSQQIKQLRVEIEKWAHPVRRDGIPPHDTFDWQVDFAEVFAPELAQGTLRGKMAGLVNATKGQMELTEQPKEGGFDIILANPPYVRHELLGDLKDLLKPIYPEVYNGLADLYVYFYGRAHQLLKNGGVSCFISSNKWLRAGYGEKLRQHLLDSQAFKLVVDFGELPLFQTAATFPAIFLWQKQPRGKTPTKWATVKNLQDCYSEGIYEHITRISEDLPASQFGKDKSRLSSQRDSEIFDRMIKSGQKLKEVVNDQLLFGIKTGLNEAFIIDKQTRDRLVEQDSKNAEVIKSLITGDDIRHYELHDKDKFLIYIPWDFQIENYPKIHDYLRKYKPALEKRPEARDGRHPWYTLTRYASSYVQIFDNAKILYPDIGKEPRFYLDTKNYYVEATAFAIPTSDWYLLGVLNSSSCFNYLKSFASVLGDENQGGRIRFKNIFMQELTIPNAPKKERDTVARLAKEAQSLHTQRRKRVEKFLREIGVEPAQSTSRNPLESPWLIGEEDFVRRVSRDNISTYRQAREETMSVTEEIVKVENEIDARVKNLYGI